MLESNLFGEYLRKRRKEMGLTLKELADNIGLTHGYISNVENGKMKGNLDLIEGINVILNIPLEDSIIRLKLDQGELDKLETKYELQVTDDYNDLLIDMLNNKPGKYYLLTRRLLSSKTLDEISEETGLSPKKIMEIEEYGPDNEIEFNKLGMAYGFDDIIHFLLHQMGTPAPSDINILSRIIDGTESELPILYKLQVLWNNFDRELSSKEVELKQKYEKLYIENYIRENAKSVVDNKADDLHFRLKDLKRVYYKGKRLSPEEKEKIIKVLDLFLDVSN